MNSSKYEELIKKTNENRHLMLLGVLPKLQQLIETIWDTLCENGKIFIIGEGSACHSIAEHLARELLSLTYGDPPSQIKSFAISMPYLFAYDNPDEIAKRFMMSQVSARDTIIIFSLTPTLGYLEPALEVVKKECRRVVIIGTHSESLRRNLNAVVIPLKSFDLWEYIELQLAVATLLIRMAADRSVKDRGD